MLDFATMNNVSTHSISRLILELKRGSGTAATSLWQRYYARLVQLARRRLGAAAGRYVDEEDVAIQAFASLCRAVDEGRVPSLQDRDGLWRLLVRIVECKVINQKRHLSSRKNLAIHEAALTAAAENCTLDDMAEFGPTPAEVVCFQEELEALIATLKDPTYVRVCLAKLEGRTNQEIATMLHCSLTSVERKLRMIRGHLRRVLDARNRSDG